MSNMKSVWSSLTLPAIIGAEPEDDNQSPNDDEQNQEDQQQTGGAGKQQSSEERTSEDDKSNEDQGNPQKKIQAQQEILDRKQRELDETKSQLQELQDFKNQVENERLSDEEKRDKEFEELQSKAGKLESNMQSLILENEFLRANDYNWHNPSAALKLVDLSEVKVSEKDGKYKIEDPQKLKDALKKLAEDNPYLVKTDDGGRWQGKSGESKSGKQGNKSASERAALSQKYPALRNR